MDFGEGFGSNVQRSGSEGKGEWARRGREGGEKREEKTLRI